MERRPLKEGRKDVICRSRRSEAADGDLGEPSEGEGRVVFAVTGGFGSARDPDGAEHATNLADEAEPAGGLPPRRRDRAATDEGSAPVGLGREQRHELAAEAEAEGVRHRLPADRTARANEEGAVRPRPTPEVPEVDSAAGPEGRVRDRTPGVAEADRYAGPAVVVAGAARREDARLRPDPLSLATLLHGVDVRRLLGVDLLDGRGARLELGHATLELREAGIDVPDVGRFLADRRLLRGIGLVDHRAPGRVLSGQHLRPVPVEVDRALEARLVGSVRTAPDHRTRLRADHPDLLPLLGEHLLVPLETATVVMDEIRHVATVDLEGLPGHVGLLHLRGSVGDRNRCRDTNTDGVEEGDTGKPLGCNTVFRRSRRHRIRIVLQRLLQPLHEVRRHREGALLGRRRCRSLRERCARQKEGEEGEGCEPAAQPVSQEGPECLGDSTPRRSGPSGGRSLGSRVLHDGSLLCRSIRLPHRESGTLMRHAVKSPTHHPSLIE